MKTSEGHTPVARITRQGVAVVALLMLAGSGIGNVQAGSAAGAAPGTKAAVAGAHVRGKGAYEGIGIHGHWIIDVKNPDGTLARHAEFENGLCIAGANPNAGDILLANLLVGAVGTGGWEVRLINPSIPTGANPGPACFNDIGSETTFVLEQSNDAFSTSNQCSLATPATAGANLYCFPTLNPPTRLIDPTHLTLLTVPTVSLAGQFVVPNGVGTTQITAVQTFVNSCINSTGAACLAAANVLANNQVTGAYLTGVAPMPSAITVVAGQSVSVNVQLSFH